MGPLIPNNYTNLMALMRMMVNHHTVDIRNLHIGTPLESLESVFQIGNATIFGRSGMLQFWWFLAIISVRIISFFLPSMDRVIS